jgi:ubiquinone/menaquinone biosynthesis C-methylase UbiE
MDQKEYWDSVAEEKVFTIPLRFEEFRRYTGENSKILDLGCGYGRILSRLRDGGYKNLYGADFSENMIARAKKALAGAELKTAPGDTIPFPDETFHALILMALLTCFPEDRPLFDLIREVRRVLKPGGILYVGDFLINDDERNLRRYREAAGKTGVYGAFELAEGAVVRHFSEDFIEKLLEGFEKRFYVEEKYTTMNGNHSRGFTYIGLKK